MNMREAAERLGQIIQKLGGGTSVGDQRELEQLRDDMLAESRQAPAPAPVAPKPKRAKKAKPRAAKTVKPLKPESVAKAKGTRK